MSKLVTVDKVKELILIRALIPILIATMAVIMGSCDPSSDDNGGSGGEAQTGQVTNVTASVNPTSYSGFCPKVFKFTGIITTNGPCEVTYRWVHVPYVNEEKTITFTAAGSKTVKFEWSVGNDLADNEHWLDLIVSEPNQFMVSPPISFDLNCVGYISGRSD